MVREAFVRLQHEILRSGYDDSIFAWLTNRSYWLSGDHHERVLDDRTNSFLAPDPSLFRSSPVCRATGSKRSVTTMSNIEATIDCMIHQPTGSAPLKLCEKFALASSEHTLLLRLNIAQQKHGWPTPCSILIVHPGTSDEVNEYRVTGRLSPCSRCTHRQPTLAYDNYSGDCDFSPARRRIAIGLAMAYD